MKQKINEEVIFAFSRFRVVVGGAEGGEGKMGAECGDRDEGVEGGDNFREIANCGGVELGEKGTGPIN